MGALTRLDGCIFNVTKIAARARHSGIAFEESEREDEIKGSKERERER